MAGGTKHPIDKSWTSGRPKDGVLWPWIVVLAEVPWQAKKLYPEYEFILGKNTRKVTARKKNLNALCLSHFKKYLL